MKKTELIGFADLTVQKRKVKSVFFDQVNIIVDWRPVSNIILLITQLYRFEFEIPVMLSSCVCHLI